VRNSEHPAYHNVSRKLRRLQSLLYNFEQPLRDDGFDYDSQYQWAGQNVMATGETDGDPALEPEVFKRMETTLKFLQARIPEHPWLPSYRLYFQLWRECYGEPIRPLTEQDLKLIQEADEPVIPTSIYELPVERLDDAVFKLLDLKLPNKFYGAFLLFLGGLIYAAEFHKRHERFPAHDFNDGLVEAARASLETAIDFTSEPGTIEFHRTHPSDVLGESHSLLYMGVAYASKNHTSAVYEWLTCQPHHRKIVSLLFAMGVRSLNDPYADKLMAAWSKEAQTALALMPEEWRAIIIDLAQED
jgi:hypothetical protein